MTESDKKIIKDILENQNPYLYLGAGFSKGAKNKAGKEIPLGEVLKDILLECISNDDPTLANEVKNKDLPTICQELKDLDQDLYINTVVNSLKGFSPTEHQEHITDYFWNSIFSVNIDDLVEQVFIKKKIPLQVFSKKQHNERIKEKEQKLFKLHGSVNEPDSGIVFATSEYNDFIVDPQNFNLTKLIIALESNDFFVGGPEFNELELEYFLSVYRKKKTDLIKFNIIFINPYPSRSFQRKVQKNNNFTLLRISSDEFFDYIHEIKKDIQKKYYNFKSLIKRCGFRSLEQVKEEFFERDKSSLYATKLYFGSEPEWEDLTYNFIICYSGIINFYNAIKQKNARINILFGPLYSGKTAALKQIFALLSQTPEYLCLYSFDSCVNLDSIRKITKQVSNEVEKIYLLYDDIGEYYSLFNDVLEIDKRINIIGTAVFNVHSRKKYSLNASLTNEFQIPDKLEKGDLQIIQQKFMEKGLAGQYSNKSLLEWEKVINERESIVSAMYSITNSNKFKSYYDNYFINNKIVEDSNYKLLLICAFCYLMDIPYVKQYMLTSLNYSFLRKELEKLDDFIKIMNDGAIRIRTKYIAESLVSIPDNDETIIELIINICISISSLIKNTGRDYDKNTYEYLTKYKYLSNVLGFSNDQIQKIYKKLQPYYSEISYFWLQLGISEQHGNNFDYSLQHFKTALAINPNSYGIQHAIARNYCKQAMQLESIVQAKEIFEIGKKKFIELIKLREYTRSKSYSVHSLIFETMNFYEKFNLKMEFDDTKTYYDLLNDMNLNVYNDYVMQKLQTRFTNFIRKRGVFSDEEYSEYESNLDY